MADNGPSSGEEHRVLNFRRRDGNDAAPGPGSSPVADLGKYERGGNEDDYRHRMIVNVVALFFIVGLIGAGIWIADTMAAMRKNQDCVLSGRRGCTQVEFHHDRW
jgi:hypothetical protein